MAYRSLERDSNYAYGSSSSCLDGVPFKISPQFLIPNQVKLQANLLKSPKHPREEYNFEIEEGVMKWAVERERALERERQFLAQKLEEEVKSGKVKSGPITVTEQDSDSEPEDDWIRNNVQSSNVQTSTSEVQNIVRERPKPPPRPLQPRGPVIGKDILTPVPISPASLEGKTESGSNKPVDVTLFETEDNPFDMFERQTLNDLEELKSVFQCTDQNTNVTNTNPIDNAITQSVDNNYHSSLITSAQMTFTNRGGNVGETCVSNGAIHVNNLFPHNSKQSSDVGDYVTLKDEPEVHVKTPAQLDLKKLPPVPPRRFLVSKEPLPPINFHHEGSAMASQLTQLSSANSSNYENMNSVQSNTVVLDKFTAQPPVYENMNKNYCKPVDSNVTNYENIDIQNERVTFSRKSETSLSHESLLKAGSKVSNSNYVNVAPALPLTDNIMRNAKSSPDIVKTVNGVTESGDVFDRAPFPISKSPPYRPSSQQSWNKYSPLPSPSGGGTISKSSSASDFASPSEVDPYVKLSPECQGMVNNLVSMGFSRPRVARAAQSFGCDEKEIVEHLFQVDKMSDAGFDPYQSELALVLYKNNKDKAEVYLRIFKQFQELGFSGDRIKEALVKFDNDSDKALDYLTT